MRYAVQHVRIINQLQSLARNYAAFFKITRDAAGTATLTTDHVAPNSAYANEISGSPEADTRHGAEERRVMVGWQFELTLAFQGEVTISDFIQSVCQPTLRLPSNDALGLVNTALRLLDFKVQHPVQGQASTGTTAKFIFEADLSRHT